MSCGGQGTIQSRGTCWFHSIINGFLLSEDGQKILYDKMKEFYSGLTPDEKLFFDDGIDAPCPFKTVKPLFFYKFLDQYLCFISGPRSIKTKAGLSPKLLENLNFAGNSATTKKEKGAQGAHAFQEILPLLDKLGFENEYYIYSPGGVHPISLSRIQKWMSRKRPTLSKTKFIISLDHVSTTIVSDSMFRPMCCSITISATVSPTNKNPSIHRTHAITGYICNNKKFIVDPNFLKPIECDWFDLANVEKLLPELSKGYGHVYTRLHYSYIIKSRIGYVSNIHPVCLLKYKKVSNETLLKRYKTIKTLNRNKNTLIPSNYIAIKRYILQKSKRGLLTRIFNPNPIPNPIIPNQGNLGVNKLGRKIYKGAKGGLYVLDSKGKKVYKPVAVLVKPVNQSNLGVNKFGRKIYKGVKGGLYVLDAQGKKVYKPVAVQLQFLNSKKRLIHVSKRGAFYVLKDGKKVYNQKAVYTNSGRLLTSANSIPTKIKLKKLS
jgi:hypothetical protein